MKSLSVLIVVTITTVVLILSITWWLEYKMIFYPSATWEWSPHSYKDIYLPIQDELIHGMYIEVDSNYPTILFYHGNAGNISHRSYMVHLCQLYKLNLIMFDYRGYGRSTGYSNLARLYQDADITASYCELNYKNLIVWGESLGGGIAAYVASKYKYSKLVLSSTFSSLDDIISIDNNTLVNRSLSTMMRLLIDTIPSKDRIKNIKIPTAIIHSIEDELIPFECSKSLLYNSPSEDVIHIEVLGIHSKPDITVDNMKTLMNWIRGDKLDVDEVSLNLCIQELKTVVDRYNI
jgi:esterase/lipase